MLSPTATAQSDDPIMHPRLAVETVASGLVTPISMAFLGEGDLLVLEKNTGRVQRVVDGCCSHGARPGGQLRLRARAAGHRPPPGLPDRTRFVYLYWTESTTGGTRRAQRDPLLGNRVDRFLWTGSVADLRPNLIIQLRAIQQDDGQPRARATTTAG